MKSFETAAQNGIEFWASADHSQISTMQAVLGQPSSDRFIPFDPEDAIKSHLMFTALRPRSDGNS